MKRILKARYTEEFKVAAVQLIDTERHPAEVAREVGVVEQTLQSADGQPQWLCELAGP